MSFFGPPPPRLPPELVRWERLDRLGYDRERHLLDTQAERRAVERPRLALRVRAWLARESRAARSER